jgi:PBP1b-binding outer membrane lipoprotein LpoB
MVESNFSKKNSESLKNQYILKSIISKELVDNLDLTKLPFEIISENKNGSGYFHILFPRIHLYKPSQVYS